MNDLVLILIVLIIIVVVSFCMCARHKRAKGPISTRRAVMSSGTIGKQPIVLMTHNHSDKLATMWKNIPWPHGEKIVVCDCDRSVVEKFDHNMIQVIVDHKHTESNMKTSLDQDRLKWKAVDTTILYLSSHDFQYAWMIENDVAFDPQTLADIMSKYVDSNYDFLAPGDTYRGDDWYWHQSKCNYACELRLGALVSFCRVSKRLVNECMRLARQNTSNYIEKLFPSVCQQNGWPMKQLADGEYEPSYSIHPKSDEVCNNTKLPLHKCTSHLH